MWLVGRAAAMRPPLRRAPPLLAHGAPVPPRPPARAELDADVRAYEAWEAGAQLQLLFSGDQQSTEEARVAAARERAAHFALDRVKCRRWIDVQCTELLGRAAKLGVPDLLPPSHLCFQIRDEGY